MPRRNQQVLFDGVRIEGSILPSEFLQRIASLAAPGQTEANYDVPKGLKLRDEIGRYWRIARGLWQSRNLTGKSAAAAEKEPGHERWLISLFTEVFGFTDLAGAATRHIDERNFPLTHTAAGGTVPFVIAQPHYLLDRGDISFGDQGSRRSPHGLLQEYLNAETKCLWGIVTNGVLLRLVRDNPSLTRPAYIEVDLERIFSEELYPDFALSWLLLHASRFRSADDTSLHCLIESWRSEAHEVGERALERLRDGVELALRELGSGFLEHPGNEWLREQISGGTLTAENLHQELLNLVYRCIFLLTTEDRDVLLRPERGDDTVARDRYRKGYSLSRLRELALSRRHFDRYSDLWESLLITFDCLATGADALSLVARGGLFDTDRCSILSKAMLANRRLLAAVHALSFFRSGATLARINYRGMDTEELGSVYESLLELVPQIKIDSVPWCFGFLGDDVRQEGGRGSTRRLTGSYYTPDALVQELIRTTLEPVIEERLKNSSSPREDLLAIKVLDPACGSGHFLLAAARRLAAELAAIEAGIDQPTGEDYRSALREVVAYCIYGVDFNPLAVELCRTALWLETADPEKPLGFLDAHIRHGNSVVGLLGPELLSRGIPQEAYKAHTGDDSVVATALRRENQRAAGGRQMQLFATDGMAELAACALDLDAMPEEDLVQVKKKRETWKQIRASEDCLLEHLKANLFTAAFFAAKTETNRAGVPTSADLARIKQRMRLSPDLMKSIDALATAHAFFHWYLAFPEVFADHKKGFDVVLGNPPWERIKLQEQEFFAARAPEIASAPNAAARGRLIKQLNREDASPAERLLYQKFQRAKHGAEASSHFVRTSGRFPLTGKGDVNLYSLFAEHALCSINPNGRAGIVVPTGIATDDSTKAYFDEIGTGQHLVSLYDFENREAIFRGVHRSYKFSLLTLSHNVAAANFIFFATRTDHLQDERRRFTLTADEIALLNPNTRTCPTFRSQADAELTKKIYRRAGVFIDENAGDEGNPWGVQFQAMFHMSNDSGLFRTQVQLAESGGVRVGADWLMPDDKVYVPLYEAKMVHHYDHRWATYEENGQVSRDCELREKQDPDYVSFPRYWVPKVEVDLRLANKGWKRRWLLGWRDICRSTDERTVLAGVIPRCGCGDTYLLMFPLIDDIRFISCLYADQCSIVHDYVARQKVGGTHLKYHTKKQIPVLPPHQYNDSDIDFIECRVVELTYSAHNIRPFAEDQGYTGPPFSWDLERRAILKAELDAYYARLYGLTRDELRYILDPADIYGDDYPSETFRVLKNKEIREYGEYRTARLILNAWDKQQNQRVP